jgi:hypothetical protein
MVKDCWMDVRRGFAVGARRCCGLFLGLGGVESKKEDGGGKKKFAAETDVHCV